MECQAAGSNDSPTNRVETNHLLTTLEKGFDQRDRLTLSRNQTPLTVGSRHHRQPSPAAAGRNRTDRNLIAGGFPADDQVNGVKTFTTRLADDRLLEPPTRVGFFRPTRTLSALSSNAFEASQAEEWSEGAARLDLAAQRSDQVRLELLGRFTIGGGGMLVMCTSRDPPASRASELLRRCASGPGSRAASVAMNA